MILKLLVLVIITHVLRSESSLKKSTSKPNIPRDLQELLDSLYMTGYIPEYILPQDELTETEKTEGEYLDFPELKNAQDDVFVPPESEYSKNNLHYKNIKARKRLIPDRHEKIKQSGLQQEIIQPEISPEDLRSDLTANVVENLTGCELKKNDSIKLDFLIPIPERGIYPHNNSINEGSSSSEYHSLNEHHNTNESNSPIEQSGLRRTKRPSSTPTQIYTSRPSQYGISTPSEISNTELTTCIDYATYEPCVSTTSNDSRQIQHNNTESTVCYNITTCVSSIPDNSRQTELNNRESTISNSMVTYNVCVSAIPNNEDRNRQTALYNTEPTKDNNSLTNNIYATTIPGNSKLTDFCNTESNKDYNLATNDYGVPTNKSSDSMSTDICSILPIDPMKNLRITQQCNTKNLNQQGLMKSPDPQRMLKILNPQWPLNTPNPQLLHEIPSSQWPMNTPNPKGLMNTSNPQGLMKIFIPPLNILNAPQWFMNMSNNRRNFDKESTLSSISSQYSFTVTDQANIPKHPAYNQNTKVQPFTFKIVNPKNEKNVKRLQFTVSLQSQPNVTIKPTFEEKIKNMFNIPKQSPPQQIINKKQQENRSRAPGLEIRNKKHPAPSSLMPSTKRKTHAQQDQTVSTKLNNSSIRVDLKTVDKNIVTNVVSLMADPLNINKMEAEVVKTDIKSSNSANNEMVRNVKTYFDMESNNSSEIESSQNNRNKEQENVNQNFINPSTERENVDSGKPKKKMFTFLNIFKKNKKYPPSDATGRNNTTQVKREIIENTYNELYRLLTEGNGMNDDYDNCEYPIEQEVQEQETFNNKRKKK